MTVSDIDSVVTYNYNGPGSYAFLFKIFNDEDLVLTHTTVNGTITVLTLNTDYTINVAAGVDGGTCVVVSPTVTTGKLEIKRNLKNTQEVDWVNNDPFDMEILESAFDKNTMLIQQLKTVVEDNTYISNWRGDWTTSTSYNRRDLVKSISNNNLYMCLTAHTSGNFNTDLAAGNWSLVFDAASLSLVPVAGYVTNESALGTGTQDGELRIVLTNGNIYTWKSSLSKWRIRSGNIYNTESDTSPYALETGAIATIGSSVKKYDGANWVTVSDLAVKFKHKLIVKTTGYNTLNIKCDELVLSKEASNDSLVAKNIDINIDITVSGLGGLDTGVEANSTMYYIWVIGNGASVNAILSKSNVTPTLPTGYEYKRLVGETYNSSGGTFVQFTRNNDRVRFKNPKVIYSTMTLGTTYTVVNIPAVIPSSETSLLLLIAATAHSTENNLQVISLENADNYNIVTSLVPIAGAYQGHLGYGTILLELENFGKTVLYVKGNITSGTITGQTLYCRGYIKEV